MDSRNSLEEQLLELLRQCTVKLAVPGGHGTGFFVASGMVLTCAHVVEPAQKSKKPVTAYWNGQSYSADIQDFLSELHPGLKLQYPDLALLKVDALTNTKHPCVFLHTEAHLDDKIYSYGYTDEYSTGDPSTFENEGWTDEQQLLLKLKEGQARSGLSGAPVLNRRTGGVCGIMKRSRGTETDLGGRAIPARVVFEKFPHLETLQQQFHQQDKRWYNCLTSQQRQNLGLVAPPNPADAIEVFYSYAEEDEKLAKEIQKHLVLLKRLNIIAEWYPGKVTLEGEEPDEQIIKHLNTARIILLLVSPDFLFSEEHGNAEVEQAMKRHNAKEAVVIPINLRNIDNWRAMPFGKLQAIPRNNKPVTEWSNRDAAFAEIAKEIRGVVERLKNANP